jgi:hypothetical protein
MMHLLGNPPSVNQNSAIDKVPQSAMEKLSTLVGAGFTPDHLTEITLELTERLTLAQLDNQPCSGVEFVEIRMCWGIGIALTPFRKPA